MDIAFGAFLNSSGFVALGYGLRRSGYLQQEDGQSAFKIALSVTLPALLFRTFSKPNADSMVGSVIIAPLIAAACLCLKAVVAWVAFKNRDQRIQRAMLMGMLPGFKIGMFVLPIIQSSFGADALRIAGVFDLPNVIFIFGYNRIVFDRCCSSAKLPPSAFAKRICDKLLLSPPMAAIWVGMAVQLAGLKVPPSLADIIGELANANKPIVMVGLGLLLQFRFNREQQSVLVEFLALRYAIALSAATVVAAICTFVEGPKLVYHVSIYILCAPVAGGNVQSAVEYGCDRGLVVAISNGADIASFVILFIVSTLKQSPYLLVLGLAILASVSWVLAFRFRRFKSA